MPKEGEDYNAIQGACKTARTKILDVLNQNHLSPAHSEGIQCVSLALPLVLAWVLLVIRSRNRRVGPRIERRFSNHSPYSSQSYTLITAVLRFTILF